jgi:hypothetical protein
MAVSILDQALTQVEHINTFCDFSDRLPPPPAGIPPDPLRAAGLDPDIIWHGLGIVGLWAALDAFTERRQQQQRPSGTGWADWLTSSLPSHLADAVRELDDMRHLYAHNFGGVADAKYFQRPRNVFKQKPKCPYRLSSGTGSSFDGQRLTLTRDDLRFYIAKVCAILSCLDSVWS